MYPGDYRDVNGCRIVMSELHVLYLEKYSGSDEVLEIPEGVRVICESAFEGAESLRKVVLPPGLSQIQDKAFMGCANLAGINLPDEITYIGDDINDIPCIEYCGITACPFDGHQSIKQSVSYICNNSGGSGAVREFIDHIEERYEASSNTIR